MTYLPKSAQYAAPVTGGTVTVGTSLSDINLVLDPAGTLATLTVTLPVATHDGQKVSISTSQILTTTTINSAAGTVSGAVTSLTAAGFASYIWVAAQTKWFRCN